MEITRHSSLQERLIRRILNYSIKHPEAKDTLEGVRHWCRGESDTRCSRADVKAALEVLVANGWVTKRVSPHAPTLYSMNRNRLEDLVAVLDASWVKE